MDAVLDSVLDAAAERRVAHGRVAEVRSENVWPPDEQLRGSGGDDRLPLFES
jgi:hypothetical protein